MEIRQGDLDDPRIIALLRHHFDTCHAVTPPGSTHVLDLTGLKSPDVDFWAAWESDQLLAVGAMKRLSAGHGEVKSMHTAEAARRKGAGAHVLRHIIKSARAKGITRLSLETGSFDYFAPARALYLAHGFVECEPFGDYRVDPNSTFLTLALDGS